MMGPLEIATFGLAVAFVVGSAVQGRRLRVQEARDREFRRRIAKLRTLGGAPWPR